MKGGQKKVNHLKRTYTTYSTIDTTQTATMASTCAICCDKTNKSTRKPIECNYCELVPCSSCVKTYLLGSSQDAHCMGCKKAWDREFLDGVMTKTFIDTEFKSHRENVLLEREKALMPETVPYAENENKCRGIQKEISAIYLMQQDITRQIQTFPVLTGDYTLEDELDRLRKISELKLELHRLQLQVDLGYNHKALLGNGKRVEVKKQFIRACPANDCRGFLSTAWKCGMCDVWVCPDCHEVIGKDKTADHTCDPGNLETARLLEKDTKPCPKCASMIFKIVGCDQMYCTQCHTPFSWKTGQVETGRIHNPHYYEYQRQINNGQAPREVGDVRCGGMPDVRVIQTKLTTIYGKVSVNYERLDMVCRLHAHIEIVEMPRFRVNAVQDNRDLRIQYLLKDIDEDAFKRTLQQREKTNSKKGEITMVLQMFLDTSADIMRGFVDNAKTQFDAQKTTDEMHALRQYTQTCLDKIGKRYKCVSKTINDKWQFY